MKTLLTSLVPGAAEKEAFRSHVENWTPAGPAAGDSGANTEALETLNALGYLDGYEKPQSAAGASLKERNQEMRVLS
ncbi:MAG: hypothetical protein GY851_12780 [bacterium]|nr:hypothetical protein [bacterium]